MQTNNYQIKIIILKEIFKNCKKNIKVKYKNVC